MDTCINFIKNYDFLYAYKISIYSFVNVFFKISWNNEYARLKK